MTLHPLAAGVYAAIRDEPLGLAGNANSLIIVRARDVVVVDAQFTREATRETLAAIRRVTPKPVGLVINTHWHDDHVAGNQVYRDTFPAVRFVMHANAAADLVGLGRPNRAGTVAGAPPAADRFVRLLDGQLGIDSTEVSPDERASVSNAIRIIRQYVAESPDFRETIPDDTVQDQLTLRDGGVAIDVRWFGCANTRGDVVIHLPQHGIVAAGDLVVAPVPYAFNAYPGDWIGVLDSVLALRPSVVVPGHGPVLRELDYVRQVRGMLAAVRDSAERSVARGDSLRSAVRAVRLDAWRATIPGDPKWRDYLFDQFFLRPAFARAFEAARSRAPACR